MRLHLLTDLIHWQGMLHIPFIGRRAIRRWNRNVDHAQIDTQLGTVMNEVIHAECPYNLFFRQGEIDGVPVAHAPHLIKIFIFAVFEGLLSLFQ